MMETESSNHVTGQSDIDIDWERTRRLQVWLWARTIQSQQQDSIDKAIIAVASGTIGITVGVNNDLTRGTARWHLVLFVVVLALTAMIASFVSHSRSSSFYSQYSMNPDSTPEDRTIVWWNRAAFSLMIVAIVVAVMAFFIS